MEKKFSYRESMAELSAIVKEIEGENIALDELASKVKRAATLIELCQSHLRETTSEVEKILKGMEGE